MNQVGYLPVYAGRRYQRGGGILSSIGRVLFPIAKQGAAALAKGVVKNAPHMINQVLNKQLTPKQALLKTAKTVGKDVGGRLLAKKRPAHRATAGRVSEKKRKRDIFSA